MPRILFCSWQLWLGQEKTQDLGCSISPFRSGSLIRTCCPCGLLLKSVNSTRPSTYTNRTPAAPLCAACACSILVPFSVLSNSILSYNIILRVSYYIPSIGLFLQKIGQCYQEEVNGNFQICSCVFYIFSPLFIVKECYQFQTLTYWGKLLDGDPLCIQQLMQVDTSDLRSKPSWLLQKTKSSETSVENVRKTWEGSFQLPWTIFREMNIYLQDFAGCFDVKQGHNVWPSPDLWLLQHWIPRPKCTRWCFTTTFCGCKGLVAIDNSFASNYCIFCSNRTALGGPCASTQSLGAIGDMWWLPC